MTLLATGVSGTAAELVAVCRCAPRLAPSIRSLFGLHVLLGDAACKRAGGFDVMRLHTECFPSTLLGQQHAPLIASAHEGLEG